MKIFTEMYLVLYRFNFKWRIKLYRGHNANEIDEKFRSSRLFKSMSKEDADHYYIFVFTGVEGYV